MNWLVRLGPLEPLIRNPAYEEIFVDSPREVGVIERTGRTVMLPESISRTTRRCASWPSVRWPRSAGVSTRHRPWSTPALRMARA